MIHREPADEIVEQAALYALGALDPRQAAAFEAHLAEGCRTCEAESRTFAAVAGQVGHAAPLERPAPELRRRLLANLGDWIVVRSTEGEWETEGAGIMRVKRLFRDATGRRFTALVRMERGVRYPSHRHADFEELYMLEGDLTVEGQVLGAGDYCAAPGGTVHGVTSSEGGCLFLLHTSEQDQVLDEVPRHAPRSGLVFARAGEGAWKTGADPGVTLKTVFADRPQGTATRLVRMEAGARLRGHRHVTAEQFYMLEGDAHVSGQVLEAGDYYRAPAGTEHEVTHTEGGCLFLVISSKVETLD